MSRGRLLLTAALFVFPIDDGPIKCPAGVEPALEWLSKKGLHIGRVRDGRLSLALVCSTVTVYYLGIHYDWGTCLNTVISLLCS